MTYTKIQLWEIYIEKNPHWKNKNITLTPAGLQKLVEQSYNHGYNHGINISSKVQENTRKSGVWDSSDKPNYDNDFMNIFQDVVKNKGK